MPIDLSTTRPGVATDPLLPLTFPAPNLPMALYSAHGSALVCHGRSVRTSSPPPFGGLPRGLLLACLWLSDAIRWIP